MRYVTHDDSGNLTGCYLQDIPPEHEAIAVECTEEQANEWTSLMWDGVQLVAKPPAPAVVVVPSSVTYRQGMAALIKHGLDAQIDAALNSQLTTAQQAGDADAILAAKLAINDWKHSTAFERGWPLIAQMQKGFGWTDAFVDALFVEAQTL